jgi:hypothetical protein
MITCSTCGNEIIWARTETGKRMPIDPTPSPDGNLVLSRGEMLPTVRPVSRISDRAPGTPLYKSHFATCKQASQHRAKPAQKPSPPAAPVLFSEGGKNGT